MPIKDLMRRGGGAKLPRLGVIRLGVKVKNAAGKEYPKEVPFFVVPEDLRAVLGDEPTAMDVSFPLDDPEIVFDINYIRYSGQFLSVRCDGEQAVYVQERGPEIVKPCVRPERGPCECGARALGRLNVIVRQAPVLGLYQVLIGGESRCRMLMGELLLYRGVLRRNGVGLPDAWFTLERIEAKVQTRKQDGDRVIQTGFPVHLRLNYSPALVLGDMALGQPALAEHDDDDDDVVVEADTPHEAGPPSEREVAGPASSEDPQPKPDAAGRSEFATLFVCAGCGEHDGDHHAGCPTLGPSHRAPLPAGFDPRAAATALATVATSAETHPEWLTPELITLLYAGALAIGIPHDAYTRYLRLKYIAEPDLPHGLSVKGRVEQVKMLLRALEEPDYRPKAVAHIRKVGQKHPEQTTL